MKPSPAPRWFGSCALAPLAWAILVMPGLPDLGMFGSYQLVAYLKLLGMVYAASLIVHLVVGAAGAAVMRIRHGRSWGGPKRVGRAFFFTFPVTIAIFFVVGMTAVGSTSSDLRGTPIPWLQVLVQGPVFVLAKFPFLSLVTVVISAAFALLIAQDDARHEPLASHDDPRLG